MCGSMVDIQSVTAEIRRGTKKKIEDRNHRTKNIMSASAMQGGHNKSNFFNITSTTHRPWKWYPVLP